MIRRSSVLTALGCVLVLASLYTFGGVIQAASLFIGVKALRNGNLWGSLSLISLALAVTCFLRARQSPVAISRLARWLRALCGCAAMFVAAWLLWPLLSDIFAADRCLDSGGSFDYVRSVCDMTENHPYVPLLDRQGFRVVGAVVFGIYALLSLRSSFSTSRSAEVHRST
jgi:hypothetical protein